MLKKHFSIALIASLAFAGSVGAQVGTIVAGKDASGIGRTVKTDATGRLEVVGAAAGGVVYGPDAAGGAPTQSPNVNAGTDAGGLIRRLRTDTTGNLQVGIIAGTNNIGDVDVLTLPSIPAGTNNIGDVDVLTLPSIPAGANNIGSIANITAGVVPGVTATSLGKAEDAVAASGDTGVAQLSVRRDTAASGAANGDYEAMGTDALGKLWVRPEGGAASGVAVVGNPVLIGGSDGTNARTALLDTSGRDIVVGASAHDAVAAGNPVLTAGLARSANPTLVTAGDAVSLGATLGGALITQPFIQPQALTYTCSPNLTTSGVTQLLPALTGANRYNIFGIQVGNGSGGAQVVYIQDGASNVSQFTMIADDMEQVMFTAPIRLSPLTAMNIQKNSVTTTSVCVYYFISDQ